MLVVRLHRPLRKLLHWGVVQLVERRILSPAAGGSSPLSPSNGFRLATSTALSTVETRAIRVVSTFRLRVSSDAGWLSPSPRLGAIPAVAAQRSSSSSSSRPMMRLASQRRCLRCETDSISVWAASGRVHENAADPCKLDLRARLPTRPRSNLGDQSPRGDVVLTNRRWWVRFPRSLRHASARRS